MKRMFFVIICLLPSAVVSAQNDSLNSFEMPRTLLKISPLQFAVRTFELGIERFNPDYSRSFTISAGYRTGSLDYDEGSGGSAEVSYRKYAAPMKFRTRNNRDSYQGIYYSLFVRGEYFEGERIHNGYPSGSASQKISTLAPGFTIGFQKTLWQILILDVYVGGGYKFNQIEGSAYGEQYYDIFDPGYTGIFPKTGLKIGIGL